MHEAIRHLSEAIQALFAASDVIVRTEHDLGLMIEAAAIECEGVLALVGAVEW